jgi:hypothetical protein
LISFDSSGLAQYHVSTMLVLHEAKGAAIMMDESHITPAFGAGMCPKLVGEVESAKRAVRVNALLVLCDEFKNPASVVGCIEAGILNVLNEQACTDPDALTRYRASKALCICSQDANGRRAMLSAKTAEALLPALDDKGSDVRQHIYDALVELSTGSIEGVHALIAASYPATLVSKAANEIVSLQPLALRLLCNCLYDDKGLEDALGHSAVETCIALLGSFDTAVRREAANTLSTLCFAEMAKMSAIQGDAVQVLITLLGDSEQLVRSAAAGALMAITTTDEGKRAMIPPDVQGEIQSVSLLIGLLREGHEVLTTNALKCVANIAVHPAAREQMRNSKECLEILSQLCVCENALVVKHAAIAKKAVLWRP